MTRKTQPSGSTDNLLIRPEAAADFADIHKITAIAFAPKAFSDGTEPDLITGLRDAGALTVSLVAALNGKPVGNVCFSPMTLNGQPSDWYGLGPIAVLPEHQGIGIGSSLANEGLRILQDRGAAGCALVGDPNYYCRFGFKVADEFTSQGMPATHFQTLTFEPPAETGDLQFHPVFKDG